MSFKLASILRRGADHFSVARYRIPMRVREVCQFYSGDLYPVCPRCCDTIDREYMRYCDRCGQRLGGEFYDYTEVVPAPRNRKR